MCVCIFFAKFLLFCGLATFSNENSFAVQVSAPLNLRKDIYTRKGFNTHLPPNKRLNSNTLLHN